MNPVLRVSMRLAALAAAAMVGISAPPASAHDETDPHAHHHMMRNMKMSQVAYNLPDVMLVRDDNRTVSFKDEINDGRPVVLTFIYTTCTSICPVISQTLSQLQSKLGADRDKVHLVSISIDPENDTPERLRAYAAKFGAGPEWQHYTGTLAASVFREDKMDHNPVVLLRAAPGKDWLRIDGFATADELLDSFHMLVAAH
jgi:protein SCO1/2